MDAERPPAHRPPVFAQPLSFGGVAEMGLRPVWCLVAWQVVVALLAGAAMAWAIDLTWGRAVRRAAGSLPDRAWIRAGQLEWPAGAATVLSEGPFVSLVVDPSGRRDSAMASDVTVFIERDGLAFRSLLGWAAVPYPDRLELPLGRLEFSANLTAWEGPVWLGVAAATAAGLLVAWWALGLAYGSLLAVAVRVLGRAPGLAIAWHTAGAALLAPALLMTAATILYATRNLTFVGFLLAFPLHIIAGWIYCAGGLASLPAIPSQSGNPFGHEPPPATDAPGSPDKPAKPANPFQPS